MAYSDIVKQIGGIANNIFEGGIQPVKKATDFLKSNAFSVSVPEENNSVDVVKKRKTEEEKSIDKSNENEPTNLLEERKKERNLYDEIQSIQNSNQNSLSNSKVSTLKKLGLDTNSIISSIGSKTEESSSKIDPWKVLEQAQKKKAEIEKAKQQNQQTQSGGNYTPQGGSEYWDKMVGKPVGNPYSYNNGASKGQCVWYVHGRFKEAFGKDLPFSGHGNGIYYSAPDKAKVSAKPENLKGGMLVSYKYGTSSAGQKYGHVIYIEAVDGDTVYYSEGGTGYYNNGTIGNVKKTTRQGIIDGIGHNGAKIGSGAIGFVDLSKV